MRRLRLCPTALIIALVVNGAALGQPQCDSCAKQLVLSKSDLQCLAGDLERFAKEPTDPIIVVLVECDKEPAPAGVRLNVDPVVQPPELPPDTPGAPMRVYVLSKAQIQCLRERIAGLAKQSDDPITFDFTECPYALRQ